MKQRPVQYFTKEYLEACKALTPDQIIEFLEGFRELMAFCQKPSHKERAPSSSFTSLSEDHFFKS